MIILTKDFLENNEQFLSILEKEKKIIKHTIKTQTSLKNILLDYMQKLADSTDSVEQQHADIIINFLNDFKNCLELFKINHNLLKELLKSLDNIDFSDTSIPFENVDVFNKNYFETNETVSKNTLEIEKVLHSVLKYFRLTFSDSYITTEPKEKPVSEEQIAQEQKIPITEALPQTIEFNITNENTLIISESKGKIFLPYTTSLLEDILNKNPDKYLSVEDIIEKEYTLPFDSFKNPAIARFREAFKLMRKKEKSSIKEAFDLGMELLFNYNLHPAIISACKNVDELDIYLDYLENNETDKFDCFKIVFDIAPILSKKRES